jgi:type I restriction enzyme S subunit
LKSNFTDFQVQTTVVGGTIPTISQEKIRNYFIALPQSKKEQTSIASYLDRKTSEIDRIIANKQKLIALYEEEKQAIINQAVTKGLDLNVKLKDSGVEWLGEIPEHWEVKKLMYLVKILSGYSPEQCQPSNNGDIEYIKVDDVDKNNFEVTNPSTYTSKKFIVSIGQTILFPKRGAAIALNKVGVVNRPICFDTNLMGLKLISENNEVFYIAYLLKSFSLISLADTSTIPQINNKHIGPFQIPLPPLIEQRDILEYINIECDKLNNIIAKVKKQIDLLREYRTTLISEVVTGKIKVPNTIEA